MNNFFTYIRVIFNKLQHYSMKMNKYNYFNQLTVFVETGSRGGRTRSDKVRLGRTQSDL